MTISKSKYIASFALGIGISFFAAAIGSWATFRSISGWYVTLERPFFAPPNWVFGPVWTVLYLLMGISFGFILAAQFKQPSRTIARAVVVFLVQLVLNVLWSVLFFASRHIFAAGIEILVFFLALLVTTILFYRIHKAAAYLLIPQLLWIAFASVLNWAFWILNRCTCGG